MSSRCSSRPVRLICPPAHPPAGPSRARARLGRVAALLALVAVLPLSAADAGDSGAHPYFNDRGALHWYTSFAEARRAAERDGKLIFIEFGRRACTNCRKLATDVLAEQNVRTRIGRVAVGLAAECDQPEREVTALLYGNLRNPRILPFVGFVTPDGRWVTGFFGGINLAGFQAHLARAEREAQRVSTRLAPAARPQQPPTAPRQSAPAAPPPRATAAPPAGRNADPRSPTPMPTPTLTPPARTSPGSARGAPVPAPTDVEEELPQDYGTEGHCEQYPEDCCPGGNCAPPDCTGLEAFPALPRLASGACPGETRTPAPASAPAAPTQPAAGAAGAWPSPAPAIAVAPPTARFPEPVRAPTPTRAAASPTVAGLTGSPDGTAAMGRPLTAALPPPVIVPKPAASPPAPRTLPAAPRELSGTPDAAATELDPPEHARATTSRVPLRVAAGSRRARTGASSHRDLVRQAEDAAQAEDWGEVIRYTRAGAEEDQRLEALNRMAHRWAHDQLAAAVRDVEAGQFASARAQIEGVARHMRGEPEGVDAERGIEAIETVQHLNYLPGDSAVRRAVRKSMYDKMRGTRWAPLFSDV